MARQSRQAPERRKVKAKAKQGTPRRAPQAGEAALTPFFTGQRLVLLAILLLAAALRAAYLIDDFPIITDEAIYLRWGEIIQNQGQWFVSLLDGKQPFSYWIIALTRFISDGDPLFAGRMISVFAGVLTTLTIYAIGRDLSGARAGLAGAFLYAVLPWAMVYDRLAYGEALVNLFGALIVYTSVRGFQSQTANTRWMLVAGLALGLGFFTKTTALLFAFIPALCGVWLAHRPVGRLIKNLAVIYGVAVVFPLVSAVSQPPAPTFESGNMILHQTSFFVTPAELWQNPMVRARQNAAKMFEYAGPYLTWPTTLAGFAALLYLSWKRDAAACVIASIALVPLGFQIFVLKMFPSRYPYPHIWPWLLLTAMGLARLWDELQKRNLPPRVPVAVLATVGLVIAGPMALQSLQVLKDPAAYLPEADSGMFFGSYPHVGHHVGEAVDTLRGEARSNGPLVLLTDAIWGVPADAMFAYLNGKAGIGVYEAWWTQLSATHPILPPGQVELMKSHHERVKGGVLDTSRLTRVFYVTDSEYASERAVKRRQPNARLMWSFPNPEGRSSLDVYRLK